MATFAHYDLTKDENTKSIHYKGEKVNRIEFDFKEHKVKIFIKDEIINLEVHDDDKNSYYENYWELLSITYNCENQPPLKTIRFIGQSGYPKSKYIFVFDTVKYGIERPPLENPLSPKRKRSTDYSMSPAERVKIRRKSKFTKGRLNDQRLGRRNSWSLYS